MTVSDSNAVTTINNAIYRKAVMMGRDEQETPWRSCLREVFFSIEVQVLINGVKRNCSLLHPIGDIASGYRKNTIWLKRTKPAKRDYRVLLAVDDSESMRKSGAGDMALRTMATGWDGAML